MIRPFTILCMIAVVASGFYLFQTKNAAMLVDRDIARIMKQVDQARERTGLLRAEYARLTGPGPIGELAAQLLPELKATLPTQYAALGDLDRRLPAIGAPQPAQPLEPQAPDALPPRPERIEPARVEPPRPEAPKPPAVAAVPARASVVASVVPPAAVQAPVMASAAVPVVSQPVAKPVAPRPVQAQQMVPPAAPVQQAPQAPVLASNAAPRSALAAGANGSVVGGRPLPVALRAPPATPGEAVARIVRGEPVNPGVPAVASALGMARTMTPSALGSAQAATFQPGSLR